MCNIRFFMEFEPNPMSAQITHYTIAISVCMLLDSIANITYETVGLSSFHSNFKAFFCDTY
jgi:hypothetical protein